MGARRTAPERRRDLDEAIERCLRGETQDEIARALGVSPAQVSRDLGAQVKAWLEEARRDFAQSVEQGLPALTALEARYWQAWEASKKPREDSWVRRGTGRADYTTRVTQRTEPAEGKPAFLAGVLRRIRRRSQLLRLSGEALERFEHEQEQATLRRDQAPFLRLASVASLLRELERRYGPLEGWLGLRCPEAPGAWWGRRLFLLR